MTYSRCLLLSSLWPEVLLLGCDCVWQILVSASSMKAQSAPRQSLSVLWLQEFLWKGTDSVSKDCLLLIPSNMLLGLSLSESITWLWTKKNKKEGPKIHKEVDTMRPITYSIKKKKRRPMSNSMSFLYLEENQTCSWESHDICLVFQGLLLKVWHSRYSML